MLTPVFGVVYSEKNAFPFMVWFTFRIGSACGSYSFPVSNYSGNYRFFSFDKILMHDIVLPSIKTNYHSLTDIVFNFQLNFGGAKIYNTYYPYLYHYYYNNTGVFYNNNIYFVSINYSRVYGYSAFDSQYDMSLKVFNCTTEITFNILTFYTYYFLRLYRPTPYFFGRNNKGYFNYSYLYKIDFNTNTVFLNDFDFEIKTQTEQFIM